MSILRRHSRLEFGIALAMLCQLLGTSSLQAACDNYPNRPVEIVVPFPAGGPTDGTARIAAEALSASVGRSFVVLNRPGASGTIGAGAVAAAAPSGYTILLTTSALATAPSFHETTFDPLIDFMPVGQIARSRIVLVAARLLPIRSVSELVELAHEKPSELTFASPGVGTPLQLVEKIFEHEARIDVTNVNYQGSAPALQDVIGNRITAMFDATVSSVPLVKAGLIRALAVSGAQRLPALPDVPTMREAGYKNVDVDVSYWVFAPKGTPACVVAFLEQHIRSIIAMPNIQRRFADLGAQAEWRSADEVQATLRHEMQLSKAVAKELATQKR